MYSQWKELFDERFCTPTHWILTYITWRFCSRHTTPLFKQLSSSHDDDAAIILLDGIYVYIQKSSNYTFQRMPYSLYKHRPLVKPMVIVGTDGYILSILGPYYAKNNDA